MPTPTKYQDLEKKLIFQRRNCWETWDQKTSQAAFGFAEDYKKFLNQGKTEFEVVKFGVNLAQKHGFQDISQVKSLKAGDRVYFTQHGRGAIFARIGKKGLKNGFKIIMAHIDSPHLDLKISPLYEDESMAFFKTHYYGGIKKYQWPTVNLALHGFVYLENGREVEVLIGEKESDPVFMITDLLPHLDKPTIPESKGRGRDVEGEDLNLLVGSIPVKDKEIKEKVKLAVLEYLNKEYGLKEEDFASAEIQAVPSEKARDLGFDRSMISAYGHDDRICSYSSFQALLDSKPAEQTQICIWVDREETGSDSTSGAKSLFIESCISELLELLGEKNNISKVYQTFSRSQAISADTSAAVDPDYKDVFDLRNANRLGYGMYVDRYTGARGKYYTSEATASYIQKIREILSRDKNIVYQLSGGLGKIDQGGGGTIAMYLANRNIETVDAGIVILNCHAPLEVASKADLYCAYLGYKAFLES